MAELFSEKGAYVVLLDIKEDVKDVAAKINPSRTLALQVDITKKENIEKVVAEIKKSIQKSIFWPIQLVSHFSKKQKIYQKNTGIKQWN